MREAPRNAGIGRIRACAALCAELLIGFCAGRSNHTEDLLIDRLGRRTLKGDALLLQVGMEPQRAKSNRAFTHGRIPCAGDLIGSVVDKVLQDVVEELHGVSDELLIVLPLVEIFEIERRKTADRRTVMRGRQENFRAEIGAVNAQSLVLEPRRKRSVGGVNEDQIGLTRMHAHLKDALPQITRRNFGHYLMRARMTKLPRVIVGTVAH